MITMGGFSLPSRTIREMICASIDVIIQAARLRDGSRRITHITEVMGMEGDTIITQDLFLYDLIGEDANGKIIGRHRSTGIGRPRFWERARYYGEEKRLAAALDAAEVADKNVEGALPMKMQALALAFLAAAAIGGVAWVFLYPLLSGEKKAENRRATVAKSEPVARTADKNQRSRREQVEVHAAGSRGAPVEGEEDPARCPPHPGRPQLVDPEIHGGFRRARRGVFRRRHVRGRRNIRSGRPCVSPPASACRAGA